MTTPHHPADDDELFSRRMLAQMLGVVIASSMFVLALYLVGVIGDARGDKATSTSALVEQMPPPPPSDEPPGSTDMTSTPTPDTSAATTAPRADETRTDPTNETTEPPAGAPRIVDVSASDVRGDSTDSCGESTGYHPLFAFDAVRETAWMVSGDGVGAAMTIELAGPSLVSVVGVVPGYDKFDPCTGTDRFEELRRLTAVRWSFDDGTSIDQPLTPTRTEQTISLDPRPVASRITMTILSTTEPGIERLDHTAVSEIVVS